VCSCVCLHLWAHLKNYMSDLHEFLCTLHMAVALSTSVRVAIHYVLGGLWMTSYLHITGHMKACGYCCSKWRHCVVVCRLTPLMCRIGCIVSRKMASAETRRGHHERCACCQGRSLRCIITSLALWILIYFLTFCAILGRITFIE